MKILIRHSKQNNLILFLIFTAALAGCGKESPQVDYAAKVNDVYLSQEELSSIVDTSKHFDYKDEIIRNWINKELLYQEAKKEGIINQENFKRIIRNSEKELAASLLIEKYLDKNRINLNQAEIEAFYSKQNIFFKLDNNAYIVNLASFKNEDIAVQFRSAVLESDWIKTAEIFKEDSSLIKEETGKFILEYEFNPVNLLKIARELYSQEVSIVLRGNGESYYVLQIVEKFNEGTIPPLDVIRKQVEKRLLYEKKEALISQYIKELYSNNEIDVKKKGDK